MWVCSCWWQKKKIVYTLVKIYVCWLLYSDIDSQHNSCFKLCHKNDYIKLCSWGGNGNLIPNISRYVQFIADLYGRDKTYLNFQNVQITYLIFILFLNVYVASPWAKLANIASKSAKLDDVATDVCFDLGNKH